MITLCYIGCAGWSLPKTHQSEFPTEGSHLERYASRMSAVEINSSFYRPHRRATYARWANSVPVDFRFSVKVPKAITHEQRLVNCEPLLDSFMEEVSGLGHRLGCLLVQLPPSLRFDPRVTGEFLTLLRQRHQGGVAVEARHASWFCDEAEHLLVSHHAARVAADPALLAAAAQPGGWPSLVYLRLHGSPKMYYSAYDTPALAAWAELLRAGAIQADQVWCILDNTAEGHALGNALELMAWVCNPHDPDPHQAGQEPRRGAAGRLSKRST